MLAFRRSVLKFGSFRCEVSTALDNHWPEHLHSVYYTMSIAFDELVSVMARLRAPGGCPWDREQTYASLSQYLLEEAYETFDAIHHADATGDTAELREELGDLLLQVIFHATIGACSRCHLEHQGVSPRPLPMDHVALAEAGLEVVREDPENPSNSRLLAWIRQHERGTETAPTHPRVTSTEAALDCASCHSTKDRHQGYFGGDCAACHRTAAWTIPEFQHRTAEHLVSTGKTDAVVSYLLSIESGSTG